MKENSKKNTKNMPNSYYDEYDNIQEGEIELLDTVVSFANIFFDPARFNATKNAINAVKDTTKNITTILTKDNKIIFKKSSNSRIQIGVSNNVNNILQNNPEKIITIKDVKKKDPTIERKKTIVHKYTYNFINQDLNKPRTISRHVQDFNNKHCGELKLQGGSYKDFASTILKLIAQVNNESKKDLTDKIVQTFVESFRGGYIHLENIYDITGIKNNSTEKLIKELNTLKELCELEVTRIFKYQDSHKTKSKKSGDKGNKTWFCHEMATLHLVCILLLLENNHISFEEAFGQFSPYNIFTFKKIKDIPDSFIKKVMLGTYFKFMECFYNFDIKSGKFPIINKLEMHSRFKLIFDGKAFLATPGKGTPYLKEKSKKIINYKNLKSIKKIDFGALEHDVSKIDEYDTEEKDIDLYFKTTDNVNAIDFNINNKDHLFSNDIFGKSFSKIDLTSYVVINGKLSKEDEYEYITKVKNEEKKLKQNRNLRIKNTNRKNIKDPTFKLYLKETKNSNIVTRSKTLKNKLKRQHESKNIDIKIYKKKKFV